MRSSNVSGASGLRTVPTEILLAYVLPNDLGDPNYYKLDTKAKVISYAMIGKGFDCK